MHVPNASTADLATSVPRFARMPAAHDLHPASLWSPVVGMRHAPLFFCMH